MLMDENYITNNCVVHHAFSNFSYHDHTLYDLQSSDADCGNTSASDDTQQDESVEPESSYIGTTRVEFAASVEPESSYIGATCVEFAASVEPELFQQKLGKQIKIQWGMGMDEQRRITPDATLPPLRPCCQSQDQCNCN